MNNEDEIERMAKTIELIKLQAMNTVGSLNKGYGMFYAEHLASVGYGDKRQAFIDFAEEVKSRIIKKSEGICNVPSHALSLLQQMNVDLRIIDDTLKEFLEK